MLCFNFIFLLSLICSNHTVNLNQLLSKISVTEVREKRFYN